MSVVGGPISAGVAGAPEAQKRVSDTKEKRRNDEVRQRRRFEDSLELHISQVESDEAVQAVKVHASEDAESERQAKPQPKFHAQPNPANLNKTLGYGPHIAVNPDTQSADQPDPDASPSIDVTG